jgi:membrane protein DedA with SNARE-associated domain
MEQLGISWTEASLGLLLLGLALTQLGLPVPETPIIVAAGMLCQRLGLALPWPILTCCAAVLAGDLALYAMAKILGPSVFRRRPLRWLLPETAQPRIDELFRKHGSVTLFVARFITGVRVCVFVLAGLRGVSVWRFVLWDGLAIALTVPVFATIGHAFGSSASDLDTRIRSTNHMLLGLCVVVCFAYIGFRVISVRRGSKPLRADHSVSPRALQEIPTSSDTTRDRSPYSSALASESPRSSSGSPLAMVERTTRVSSSR